MKKGIILLSALIVILVGCKIEYKLNQASVDYTKVKTVSVAYFPNRAGTVNPTLSNDMTEGLKDRLLRETKLTLVPSGGDLRFEGEITGYTIAPIAIKDDATAAQTRLTMTVKVRFTNKSDDSLDYESSFSAFQDFASTANLSAVESDLDALLVDQLSQDIFNKALANW